MKKLIGAVSCVCALFLSEMAAAAGLPDGWTKMESNYVTTYVRMSPRGLVTSVVIPSDGMSAAETAHELFKKSNCKIMSSSSVQELFCHDSPGKTINFISQVSPDSLNLLMIPCGDNDYAACLDNVAEILNFLNPDLNSR